MIDVHSHILPALDDGAKTAEESAAMLALSAADGVTDIVATPHANARYSYDRLAIEQMLDTVRGACPPGLTVHCGCDFHLNLENIRDAVKNPWRYVIDETPYILVELPDFFNVSAMDRILSEVVAAGLIPVITHPERHPILQSKPELLNPWVERDCRIQVTAQSILGDFGRTARQAAAGLLNSRLVHFIASDAHDTQRRPPVLSKAREEVRSRYGAALAEALFVENPRKLLEGAHVPAMPKRARRFFTFGE
jgi:protein-tyrosine phosphatase